MSETPLSLKSTEESYESRIIKACNEMSIEIPFPPQSQSLVKRKLFLFFEVERGKKDPAAFIAEARLKLSKGVNDGVVDAKSSNYWGMLGIKAAMTKDYSVIYSNVEHQIQKRIVNIFEPEDEKLKEEIVKFVSENWR